MKYLITESKLDNVVSMYLDNQDFVIYDNKKRFNNYIYFLNSESDGISQICVYHKDAFGDVRNQVFVKYDLIEELSNFFSIDKFDCLDIIGAWVSNTLSIKISMSSITNIHDSHRLIVKTE